MGKRALLVNDSKFENLILQDMLQKLGFTVEIADEFDALYAIERYEPDLVIVNYIMETTRGDKLIQLMKVGMPHIKCVLSSSNDLNRSEFEGVAIDGILKTPVSPFLLERVLEEMGGIERGHREKAEIRCNRCNEDLSNLNIAIVFCPYCGAPIGRKG